MRVSWTRPARRLRAIAGCSTAGLAHGAIAAVDMTGLISLDRWPARRPKTSSCVGGREGGRESGLRSRHWVDRQLVQFLQVQVLWCGSRGGEVLGTADADASRAQADKP